MKHLNLVIIILLGTINFALGQTPRGPITPPENISQAFERDNANAVVENITWWEEANQYIVDFTKKNHKQRGYYTRQGTWKYTDISIKTENVKQKIFGYLDKNYTYDSFEAFFHDEKNNNFYLIKIKNKGKETELKFDENTFDFIGENR